MSSDAPGRASDLKEIRELKEKGKETLILVTGSDFNDEDWDNDGWTKYEEWKSKSSSFMEAALSADITILPCLT